MYKMWQQYTKWVCPECWRMRSSKSSRAILWMEVTKQFSKLNSSSSAKKYIIPYPAKLCMMNIKLAYISPIKSSKHNYKSVHKFSLIKLSCVLEWNPASVLLKSPRFYLWRSYPQTLSIFSFHPYISYVYVCFWFFFSLSNNQPNLTGVFF